MISNYFKIFHIKISIISYFKVTKTEFLLLCKLTFSHFQNTLLTNYGEVAVVFNSRFNFSPMSNSSNFTYFKFLVVKIFSGSRSLIGFVVYRTAYAS